MKSSYQNPDEMLQTYDTYNKQSVRFDQGGIIVLNAQSCKGLEFDIVILADIHDHPLNQNNQDLIKKLF